MFVYLMIPLVVLTLLLPDSWLAATMLLLLASLISILFADIPVANGILLAITIGIVAMIASINHRKFRDSNALLHRNHILLYQLANAYTQLHTTQQKLDSTAPNQLSPTTESSHTPSREGAKLYHDLRTPITMIMGFCEALLNPTRTLREPLSVSDQDDVKAIYRNARFLQDLMDSSFESSVAQPKPVTTFLEKIDPIVILKEAASMTMVLMEQQNLSLRLNIPEKLPLVSVEHTQVRQILLTMLTNAASIVSGGTIDLEATVKSERLYFTVTSTGSALQSNLDELPFQKQLTARWNLSKQLAEMHNGHLSTETMIGKHSVFVLDLPITDYVPEAPKAIDLFGDTPTQNIAKAIILVEDDPAILAMFRSQITHYQVLSVHNATELGDIKDNVQPVALILSGEQNYAKIVEITYMMGNSIPIITCTIPNTQPSIQAHGNLEYLAKPIDYDVLSRAIQHSTLPIQKILIIDDNQDNVQMLSRMLESMSEKYTIWKAYSGHEGLALLSEQRMDVIILDIVLPDTDGFVLAHSIHMMPNFAETPILLMSAYPNPQAERRPIMEKIVVYQPIKGQAPEFVRTLEALIHALDSASDRVAGEFR
ncbi:MAG: hybrid sensor histidine kinase/response regulator [Chloroflexota bacterium]